MAVWIQSLYQYAYTRRLSSYPWQFEYRVSTSMPTQVGSMSIYPWQFEYRVSTSMPTRVGYLYIYPWQFKYSLYQYTYSRRLSSCPWQFVCTSMPTPVGSISIYIHGSLNTESLPVWRHEKALSMAVWIQRLYQYDYMKRLYTRQFEYSVSASMTTWKGSVHGSLNAESLPLCLFEKALYISIAVWIQSLYQYAYTGRLSLYISMAV